MLNSAKNETAGGGGQCALNGVCVLIGLCRMYWNLVTMVHMRII